jgi:hypothetical protein
LLTCPCMLRPAPGAPPAPPWAPPIEGTLNPHSSQKERLRHS